MNTPVSDRHKTWESDELKMILLYNFGYEYGENPEQRLDEIRRDRGKFSDLLVSLLHLGSADVAVDLGSGIGLQAEHIARKVHQLHCVDLSESFLTHCRKMVDAQSNVEFHHIPFADLSVLKGRGVTKVYATAVFIHFNVYDIWLYLTELAKYIEPNGLIGFDFGNAETINPERVEWINHANMYKADRKLIDACMNYHSLSAIDRLLALTGFERIDQQDWQRVIFVVARKKSDATKTTVSACGQTADAATES